MSLNPNPTILFTVEYCGEEYRAASFAGQYYSLMSLIADQIEITGFGLCNGMGSCETCMVKIDGTTALACEVRVDDHLANARIRIEEGRYS